MFLFGIFLSAGPYGTYQLACLTTGISGFSMALQSQFNQWRTTDIVLVMSSPITTIHLPTRAGIYCTQPKPRYLSSIWIWHGACNDMTMHWYIYIYIYAHLIYTCGACIGQQQRSGSSLCFRIYIRFDSTTTYYYIVNCGSSSVLECDTKQQLSKLYHWIHT